MNFPNQITIARIVLIFIVLVMCSTDGRLPADWQQTWRVAALMLAVFAGFTDFLDGYIARKFNLISDFGKLMDPLADKIFIATAFIVLVDKGVLPGWVAVVILSREFLVTGLRQLAASKGSVMAAETAGKLKTVMQMFFLILGGAVWLGWVRIADIPLLWTLAVWSVVLITLYSGISYFVRHRSLYLDMATATSRT
jgi:CDP-diacylglycerol---glycerol-3-phosphate 3-phosphatidyltransferase